MIIKSFEINKINLKKINFFLLYGENEGFKNQIIKKEFENKFNKNILRYEEKEVLDNKENISNEIFTHSFFENEKLIIVSRCTDKIHSFIEEVIEKKVTDIIINPHAIPSRMTIAQLLECIMSKACLSTGSRGNATSFMYKNNNEKKDDIASVLQKSGYDKYGNEIMYNPRTGEQVDTNIFIGPTYYQRLKHMVQDKIHSRSANGPIILMTRQPAEGRAREGGLRLGEMEVECNWGHGSLQFLKERLMECSDNYRLFICKTCGNISNVNPNRNIYVCHKCKNNIDFSQIRIPYACKLLFQEIQSLAINTKFLTQ